jgi:hypothetical protein
MSTIFKIPQGLLNSIHVDLSRPHQFAHERVGFIACRNAITTNRVILLADSYQPIEDEDYLYAPNVGAMMGPNAIRKALQFAYKESVSMFHVHRHEHKGLPRFSPLDLRENAKFVPDFWKVRPRLNHGAILLSQDSIFGLAWDPIDKRSKAITEIAVIGRPLFKFWG